MKTPALVVLLSTVSCAFSQNGKIALKNPVAFPEGRAPSSMNHPLAYTCLKKLL